MSSAHGSVRSHQSERTWAADLRERAEPVLLAFVPRAEPALSRREAPPKAARVMN